MMIDTHTHLYLEEFDNDRERMIQTTIDAGVGEFYMPNIDSSSIQAMLEVEALFPGVCMPMMGLHPCSVNENYKAELEVVRSWLNKRPFSAIGEIGIDLYWDKTWLEQQKDAFLTQIDWALEFGLPIVIHSRDSIDLIIEMLEELGDTRLRGIFHCFGGSLVQAERIIALGFLLGIGGVITFKKSDLGKTLKKIPLEYLVLETDSPYLAPVPFRGKRNESAYLKIIAEKLAEVKGLNSQTIIAETTKNAKINFTKKAQEK